MPRTVMAIAKVYIICQKTLAIEAAFYNDSVTVSNQPLQPMLSVYTKEL